MGRQQVQRSQVAAPGQSFSCSPAAPQDPAAHHWRTPLAAGACHAAAPAAAAAVAAAVAAQPAVLRLHLEPCLTVQRTHCALASEQHEACCWVSEVHMEACLPDCLLLSCDLRLMSRVSGVAYWQGKVWQAASGLGCCWWVWQVTCQQRQLWRLTCWVWHQNLACVHADGLDEVSLMLQLMMIQQAVQWGWRAAAQQHLQCRPQAQAIPAGHHLVLKCRESHVRVVGTHWVSETIAACTSNGSSQLQLRDHLDNLSVNTLTTCRT